MLIRFFLQRYFSEAYPSKMNLLAQIFAIFLELSIYWYTAKAVGGSFSTEVRSFGMSYFDYIVIGEFLSALPMAFFSGVVRVLQSSFIDGTFETFLLAPRQPCGPFVLGAISIALRDFFYSVLFLIIAAVFFEFNTNISSIMFGCTYLILSAPLFLSLGLIAASVIIVFGRGAGVVNHVTSVAVIFAGTYFPLSVLPQGLQFFLLAASPFAFVLEAARSTISSTFSLTHLLTIILWTVVALPLSYYLFNLSLHVFRKKGRPLVLFG